MFTDAQLAAMRTTARDGWLAMAQARAIAGPTLSVIRTTGDDRAARPTDATIGTVEGYVYSPDRLRIATPQAPDFTPVDAYRLVSGTGVITPAANPPLVGEGDTLVDPGEPAVGWQVSGMESLSGPFVAIVQPVTL